MNRPRSLVGTVVVLSLCGIAWADHDISDPYYAAETHHVGSSVVTVDGDLSEWAGASWVALDETLSGSAPDVVSARYAVRWNTFENLIYVAVEVVDTDHQFGPADGAWNARDIVEITIDAGNHNVNFMHEMGYGQQIIIDGGGMWVDAAWEYPVGCDLVPAWAAGPVGDTLTYEVAIVPYAFYAGWGATDQAGILGGDETVEFDLPGGTAVGLDVVVGAKSAGSFGQLANNLVGKKFDEGANQQTWCFTCDGTPLRLGDLNQSGMVDLDDFMVLKWNFGKTQGAQPCEGDLDCDGDVDLDDFALFKRVFGTSHCQ